MPVRICDGSSAILLHDKEIHPHGAIVRFPCFFPLSRVAAADWFVQRGCLLREDSLVSKKRAEALASALFRCL
jgi:hypothetical protein